jgi:hypothetical protein
MKDWGTRVHESSIRVTTGGLVVQTGEVLRLLTKDLIEHQALTLSTMPRQNDDRWSEPIISVSASQKTFMVNRFNQKSNISLFDVFDGNTFKVRYSWIQSPPLYDLYSISDQAMAAVSMPQQKGILYSEFASGKWRPLGDKSESGCNLLAYIGFPNLINDEQLVIISDGRVCLCDIEGRCAALSRIDDLLGEKTAISQDGRFVAISLGHLEIKKHIFAEPSTNIVSRRIAVYDVPARKWALMLHLCPLPKNDYDFALSPDGSKLAILNDRRVSVYSVPGR